jgi:glyoxylase-like metal-dependent hydrolase (beta-lactamase superfamily II)
MTTTDRGSKGARTPTGKAKKAAIFISIGALTLVLGAGFGLRSSRKAFSPPVELRPGLWMSKVGGGVTVVIAQAGPHAILFDTGMDAQVHGVDALLVAAQRTRTDVSDIFLTHGHGDHTAGLAALPEARVFAGAADVDLIAGRAPPETFLPRVFALLWSVPPGRVSDPLVGEGPRTIRVPDGRSVLAIPVPGHTPGSYAYVYDQVLFPGDIMILENGQLAPTPGLFNPHPAQNLASLRSLGRALADVPIDRVCTSHGGCTLSGQGRPLLDGFLNSLPAP